MKRILLIFVSFLFGVSACAAAELYKGDLRDGDIIFHRSRSGQSAALQEATDSPYTHMGIIFLHNEKPYVFEAAHTVRSTPFDQWVARGEGGHYVVKRLKEADRYLTPEGVEKLWAVAKSFTGRHYDVMFAWSDDKIYCSELVWKIYERALGLRIGELNKMRDFKMDTLIVREAAISRYGSNVPLDETVIAPVSMFNSPLLETVVDHSSPKP